MRAFLTCVFASAILLSCNYKSQSADTVFHNAQIIDCDGIGAEKASSGAIAVKDGRIVAVGPEQARGGEADDLSRLREHAQGRARAVCEPGPHGA